MTDLFKPFRQLAREAVDAARAALRRGALIALAVLIAGLGLGFLLAAGFIGLRFLLGPGLAALALGTMLLVIAAVLVLLATRATSRPARVATPKEHPAAPLSPPADAATTAVFVAAFLLGRRLADHWDES